MILKDFTELIDQLYPADQVPDPLDQEAARHEAYARSRRLAFVGREDLLRRMTAHVAAGGNPLVLTGESGCGKSALLAEWVAGWREEHPDDLVVQHYIGSTPDSADWQGLVRRVLAELKRAYQIPDELPMQPDALRTALNDWLVKAAGQRGIVLVLDALNQLTDDGAAHQLGWLPRVFPPNVRVLVSSLAGDALEAVRRRGWPELAVPLFGKSDIAPAARAYFRIFAKKPDDRMLQALEGAPAATNALYLRAVLDELRQFGQHEKLPEHTAWYLAAKDLPSLFDRILTRWDDDFGKDPQHPDLVRRSLCLIACARFGLAEAELLDLLGKDGLPLPRRSWAPLHLAAENALSIRAGLLNFGHDYLRAAVRQRWLADEQIVGEFSGQVAGYFARIGEPTDRKLDELPTLLRDTQQWASLKDLLADIPTFLRLRKTERWKWELHGFWIPLRKHFDPGKVYRDALAGWEAAGLPEDRLAHLLNEVASFHHDSGDFGPAGPLFRRALEVRERVLGPEHPDTLTSVNNLAGLLESKGDCAGAEPLYRRALEAKERGLGPEHPDTLTSVNNLAFLLDSKGNCAGAEPLYRWAMEANEQVLGPEHPHTLMSMNNLATLLEGKGDYGSAEPLYRLALEVRERVLGPEHPDTLMSLNNLALLLTSKADYAAAEPLYRRALEASERVLGPEHPDTLMSVNNLGGLLENKGDYAGAEPLLRRVLEVCERVLGPEHPHTLASLNNLAALLKSKGDYAGSETLYRRVLEASELVLGPEHPDTLTSVSNLALLLKSRGDYSGGEPLYRRALEAGERVLGPDHPDTLRTVKNLARLLYDKGDYAGAKSLLLRALGASERVLGPEHPDTLASVNNLAVFLETLGDYAGAEPLCRRSLEGLLRVSGTIGRPHPNLNTCIGNYARLLQKMGQSTQQIRSQLNEILRPFGMSLGG
jgi:tetratricopeptide (TPR) repeat protein